MNSNTIYIPLGFQCTTAEILKKTNKRICSFPFDWIISTPESILELLKIVILPICNIELFVKNEFFKIDNLLSFLKQEEFISHPEGNILFNSKYNLIFPHFKNDNETITKMISRFERLRNYILYQENKIVFLFINRLVNNNFVVNDNCMKFSINKNNINLKIKDTFIKINEFLLGYISENKFKINIINAVDKIDNNTTFHNNIIYNEIVPINNNNLTDEEIIKLII
jgi:hypothetical protein